jgi:hypothetical protein
VIMARRIHGLGSSVTHLPIQAGSFLSTKYMQLSAVPLCAEINHGSGLSLKYNAITGDQIVYV